VPEKIQESRKMVVWGPQRCVDAETVLCLRFMPVMHRHQLAVCESEKEGSTVRWKPLSAGIASHSADQPVTSTRCPCRLKQVVDLHVREAPLKTESKAAHAATAVFQD